ncbi:MAG TPA: POTRA domain-containing protein [Vicinamibacterales bacterium]|nr:POTRA domain-containing protein [Vicinamibacterales bacterium]
MPVLSAGLCGGQHPSRIHLVGSVVASGLLILAWSPALAQQPPVVTELRVEQEGRTVTDPEVLALIGTTVGQPLSVQVVTESIQHLSSIGLDSEADQEDVPGGLRVTYRLVPRRPIDKVEFRGNLALGESTLQQALREQFGVAPTESRRGQAEERLRQFYRDHGYPSAQVSSETSVRPKGYGRTLVFTVDAGPRARIKRLEIEQDSSSAGAPPDRLRIQVGDWYDAAAVRKALDRYVDGMRKERFYEATAEPGPVRFEADGAVVPVSLHRGRRVRIEWAGDPIPRGDQERLVPVRREASVEETLQEDWTLAIGDYLHGQGYRDAKVDRRASPPGDADLVITFTITRGPRYFVSSVQLEGAKSRSEKELRQELGLKEGEPFVQGALAAGMARISGAYRALGFTGVEVRGEPHLIAPERPAELTRQVQVAVTIREGAKRTVSSIDFSGNESTPEERLRALIFLTEGGAFSPLDLSRSLDNIRSDYQNRGFLDVILPDPLVRADEQGPLDITFRVVEGPQIIVDRIIVDGNERTSRQTIERELTLVEGEPLGQSAKVTSEARLMALGLFRRARIDVRRHGGDNRADAVVVVNEALATTLGYGGGIEISSRLRPIDQSGIGEERIEFVPRGFFEIGRRNMFGKPRSINLFTRVSGREQDSFTETGLVNSTYGVHEYRVYGTYTEPKAFGTPSTMLFTGIAERAIRTSYTFETREARAEVLGSRWRDVGAVFRFSIERTNLFDVKLPVDQLPLIDRFFPQVRLSKFSGSLIRDTRSRNMRADPLDPEKGTVLSADGEWAARAIGSEVGYVKGFVQGSWYRQLPATRQMVVALRGALGAAHGFPRTVSLLDADGNPVPGPDGQPLSQLVQDLPASERFFAGGATTNRGFSTDQLANEDTISPGGFPTGGNGEILLNGELRVDIVSSFAGVVFMDAGNVFKYAADISLGDLRPAAGFGVHYRSRVFPIRVELGFNLDRRELSPGRLERGTVLQISLGPAF